ncbi:MAG: gliding motility-associated C-terminal domain-containing protein [Prevotella sp.]
MGKRLIFVLFAACFSTFAAFADFNPTAYYSIDGEETEVTDAIVDAQAPLEVRFSANPTNLGEGDTFDYEWRLTRNGETTPLLTRHEETTTYVFRESGAFQMQLFVTLIGEQEPELVGTITVSIANSFLEMPNAFSPNGDGINDVYKAKSNHKSIIEFNAYIFNRWGQKIYEWTDIDGGWDGTWHGKQVKDGTYFVLVKARGADGRQYNIKRDVNILRNYIEE